MGNIQKELDWIERAIDDFAETSIRGGEYWRASYTEEDRKGIEMLTSWMEEAGMEVYMDDICNLFGRIEGESDAIIMTGTRSSTPANMGVLWASCAHWKPCGPSTRSSANRRNLWKSWPQ